MIMKKAQSSIRLIETLHLDEKAFILFEYVNYINLLNYRVSWFVEFKDALISKIIETKQVYSATR